MAWMANCNRPVPRINEYNVQGTYSENSETWSSERVWRPLSLPEAPTTVVTAREEAHIQFWILTISDHQNSECLEGSDFQSLWDRIAQNPARISTVAILGRIQRSCRSDVDAGQENAAVRPNSSQFKHSQTSTLPGFVDIHTQNTDRFSHDPQTKPA